jgi:cell division protein FtsX
VSSNKYKRMQLVKLADKISGIIRRIIIVCIILLIFSQAALQNNAVRHWLTGVDQWEGTRLN